MGWTKPYERSSPVFFVFVYFDFDHGRSRFLAQRPRPRPNPDIGDPWREEDECGEDRVHGAAWPRHQEGNL